MYKIKKLNRTVRLKSLLRSLRRRRNQPKLLVGMVIVGLVAAASSVAYQSEPIKVNPAAYTPLLDTIAKGESSGNYNAYYGNAGNTTIRFTDMSIAQVMRWQEDYVRQGSASSAVGRYQIVRPTLAGLVARLEIDTSARFDEAMQDRMAIALLERRGASAYVNQEISREQFAANLAQEWAALPKTVGDNPTESYYADDGINKSRITIEEVFRALAVVESYI